MEKSNYHMDPLEYRLISFKIIFTLIQEFNQAYTDENWFKVEKFGISRCGKLEIFRIEKAYSRTEPNQKAENFETLDVF